MRRILCLTFFEGNVFREMGDFWRVSGLYLRRILCLAFFEGNVFREMGGFRRKKSPRAKGMRCLQPGGNSLLVAACYSIVKS